MSRRRSGEENKASWAEMLLFVLIVACIYCVMALFGSSLVGEGGRKLGDYLRSSWGGAVIVPLLFGIYASIAKLLNFRIPRFRRQFFGTVMLYFSFTFLLGLLKELDWTSDAVLLTPGKFGAGLAKFFVLNAGTFITLLLVGGSFLLSAIFFGSKILKLRLPKLPSLKFRPRSTSSDKAKRKRERVNQPDSPSENGISEPSLRPSDRDFSDDVPPTSFYFQPPILMPDPNTPPPPPEIHSY